MRYFAVVEYEGTKFFGWQIQVGQRTVQNDIQKAISTILNTPTKIYGSGRTDGGVHAYGQTFHFDGKEVEDLGKFKYSLNQILPADIHIKSLEVVPDDFHARFSAKSKTYQYVFNMGEYDLFNRNREFQLCQKMDVKKIKEAASCFVGKHNFKNFTSKDEDDQNFVREIFSVDVKEDKDKLVLTFVGTGFMRYMVRMMVGTLMMIGLGKLEPNEIEKLLNSEERNPTQHRVSAEGLTLVKVTY